MTIMKLQNTPEKSGFSSMSVVYVSNRAKVAAMCLGWARRRTGWTGATRTPEEGAETAICLATLPEDGPIGGFYRDWRPINW